MIESKRKIIHLVLGKANPNRMNGVNKVVSNLATTMVELIQPCEVWGITPTPDDRSDLPERNFETRLFQAFKNPFKIDNDLNEAIAQLQGDEVFHLHGGFIPAFYNIHKILKANETPYVITPHGCYNKASMQNGKWKKTIFFQLFEKKLLQNAKALHCLGKSEVEAVNEALPKLNKVIIPNGQNFEELNFEYEEIQISEAPVFSFCGRMDKKMKGLDLLLNGFAKYLTELNGKGKLWLIGGGYQIDELKVLSNQLNLSDTVVFWGKQFGAAKNNILANSDIFYHPSRYEGMPTAILEAAALKLPCVVSDATNMLEYIQQNKAGLTLPNNTIEEVAQSMKTVETYHQNGKLKTFGENANMMVKNLFSWEKVVHQLCKVYYG